MNIDPFASAILGHLIGDFILQNDWIAMNKKRPGPDGFAICWLHCTIWMACVMVFSGMLSLSHYLLAGLILFAAHFVQDRTNIIPFWMKLIGQRLFMKSDTLEIETDKEKDQTVFNLTIGCGPWSMILVDNIFHLLTIWLVLKFVA